jgi:hypothetical protein
MSKRRIDHRARVADARAQTGGNLLPDLGRSEQCGLPPGGPFARLFATAKDRLAFDKVEESRQIDRLIDSLPEPPVGPQRREYSGKCNVRIPKSLHAALASEAEAGGLSLN